MALEHDLEDIRSGIKAGRFVSEAAVSQGIVLRILHALGWQTYDTQTVCPEYSLSGRRVDFALCHPPGKPAAFVEVKQLGQTDGAERQLFEYAFHAGIPMAILTDGQEWNFFLPGEQGDYGERRVYKLDIVGREISECVERLQRYLRHEAVVSGEAIRAARQDYMNVAKERQIRSSLPVAWEQLVKDEDDLLIEIIADKVENLCGFKPDPDTVAKFLRSRVQLTKTLAVSDHAQSAEGRIERPVGLPDRASGAPPSGADSLSTVGFVLDGRFYSARNARDVLVRTFDALAERDSTFLERFASLPKHGRTRRYVARTPEELYPGRADLAREHSARLKSGWWIGTNVSRATIKRIIEMAGDVVGLKYGASLKVNLGE